MHFKELMYSFVLIITCLTEYVICNSVKNSTDSVFDNSFNFEEFDDSNKMMLNLNQNCSLHDDCNVKHSICDPTFNTCECDITSMQTQLKCRTVYCMANEDCMSRFADSMCTLGRCQCISGRKFNGKCLRASGMMFSSPLPDWAIISIAVTLALSVIAGGSLQKKELRQQLLKIIRLFLQRDSIQNDTNSDSISDITTNKVHNKDIEL